MAGNGKLIRVTAEHIEDSIETDSNRCMVAQAVKDAVPGATRVMVDTQTIRYTKDGVRRTFLTKPSVQQAILDFDYGRKPDPFNFRLGLPVLVQTSKQAAHRSEEAAKRELTRRRMKRKVSVFKKKQANRENEAINNITVHDGRSMRANRGSRRFGLRNMRATELEAEAGRDR